MATWHDDPGDTPLDDPPTDYYPPGSASWFEIPDGRDAGKRMFVRDSTHGDDPEETVVFVHGNPENSYTYRTVARRLINGADRPLRVVAMDHVGFGLSDTADYEMVCQDHARNLSHLLDALALSNVTLVVHDWGGPIGVGGFLDHHESVSNLVVCNSTVFPMPEAGYTYHGTYPSRWLPWSQVPRVVPDTFWQELAAYAPFQSPQHPLRLYSGLVLYILARRLGRLPNVNRDAQRVFAGQFRDRGNVRASKRLVRQTPYWGHGNVFEDPDLGERDTRPFYQRIQDRVGEVWGPEGGDVGVRAVVGRWDPCGKPEVLDQWREALPQLEGNVTAFEDVGHFVEEARPTPVAAAIAAVADL
ncbi:MAG: alpha/beta fold hydrolase [Halorientalis sp.]